MKQLNLTLEDFNTIQHLNKLLELTGEELIVYCEKNEVSTDSLYLELSLELDKYIVELCVFSGDEISPAFWGEARLRDYSGNQIYFTEPLDDFDEFYLEDYENDYGLTMKLDKENKSYILEEDEVSDC